MMVFVDKPIRAAIIRIHFDDGTYQVISLNNVIQHKEAINNNQDWFAISGEPLGKSEAIKEE